MSDSLALPAIALIAIGLVALALVWPQGQGAQSPSPFGHPVASLPAPIISALKHPLALRGPEPAPKPAGRRAARSSR
jgi:hypothetical protein